MQLAELKLVFASNLIKLRAKAGMTQAGLGEKLNYSDKTISKWERGEAIPDAFVLTQMAELFGVTVDFLLTNHDAWESPEEKERRELPVYSANVIILIGILGVFTAALTAFVVLWLLGIVEWRVFLLGLSLSLLVHVVLDSVFYKAKHLQYVLSAFIVSLFVLAYFVLRYINPWPMFLIAIPAVAIVFLACNIRKKPKFLKKFHIG